MATVTVNRGVTNTPLPLRHRYGYGSFWLRVTVTHPTVTPLRFLYRYAVTHRYRYATVTVTPLRGPHRYAAVTLCTVTPLPHRYRYATVTLISGYGQPELSG